MPAGVRAHGHLTQPRPLHRYPQSEVVPGKDATIREAKDRAAKIKQPSQLWDLEQYLTQRRQHIDRHFDFRYSALPLVFANLIREGRPTENELHGLAQDKLTFIRWHASLESAPTSRR